MNHISPQTQKTLEMLRKAPRALATPPSRMKRPTGGRPNPVALHHTTEARGHRSAWTMPDRPLKTNAQRLVEAVNEGRLPLDEVLTAGEILTGIRLSKIRIDHLAAELKETRAAYAIRTTGRGRSARYVIVAGEG